MYTIGQVSAMFNLPVSTLRYYDKEGFFPNLERKGNIRYFSDNELEALRIIECLKKSGLEIKDIKQFFIWVSEGSSSYEKRKELFEARKSAVETEIKEPQKTLSLLKFKCWYYETAISHQAEMSDESLHEQSAMSFRNAHRSILKRSVIISFTALLARVPR